MATSGKEKKLDISTEEKILESARKVFMQKGYSATRTRDIAEDAGINLALLNYYFRSKEKLFLQVMAEKLHQLFGMVLPIVNNDDLSLYEKIETLVDKYIDLLVDNPDLTIFVLNEIKVNPDNFKETVHIQEILKDSSLIRQLKDKRPDVDPVQILSSMLGMLIFPFIAKPILFPEMFDFKRFMKDRKILITKWIKALIES